jgi:hypothetical protein
MECIVRFSLGSTPYPKIGSVITVKHSGYWSSGILRDPYFWRERTDAVWEDLVASTEQEMDFNYQK